MPGGIACSVFSCKNNSKKAIESGLKLSFFSFPKDPKIRKEWAKKCYRKDIGNVSNKRICGIHFKPDDFEDEVRAKIMNTQPKILKKSAVPSLYLLNGQETQNQSEKPKRKVSKKSKAIVKSSISRDEEPSLITEPADEIKPEVQSLNKDLSERPSLTEEAEYDILEKNYEELQNENLSLKKKIDYHENQQNLLQQHICDLEKQVKKAEILNFKKSKNSL